MSRFGGGNRPNLNARECVLGALGSMCACSEVFLVVPESTRTIDVWAVLQLGVLWGLSAVFWSSVAGEKEDCDREDEGIMVTQSDQIWGFGKKKNPVSIENQLLTGFCL